MLFLERVTPTPDMGFSEEARYCRRQPQRRSFNTLLSQHTHTPATVLQSIPTLTHSYVAFDSLHQSRHRAAQKNLRCSYPSCAAAMQILSSTATTISSLILLILSFSTFITPSFAAYAIEERQNAAVGGGAGAVTQATGQAATTTNAASLITAAGTTTVEWVAFTQTFNSSLGTWAYPTALSGSIGLGSISGTVG